MPVIHLKEEAKMHTIIIAEAGVNHNGSIDLAKKLIDGATEAGADFIKFQTFNAEKIVGKYALKAEYQHNESDHDNTQFSMLKKLELNKEAHLELIAHCNLRGIKFFSTAFDSESIELLSSLNIELFKIPSGEITNKPFLQQIASKGKPVIMSTGLANLEEVRQALNILLNGGLKKEDITLLHCTTAYPAPMDDVNLKAMQTLETEFNIKVGYSDHTKGIEIPIAAVALGATVVEKHITLDRNLPGPDHKASIEIDELKKMIRSIRNVEKALGKGIKEPAKSELKNTEAVRKSIVAARAIIKNEKLSSENLTIKRPGNGISPMLWDEVIGKTAIRDFNEDEAIEL
jgi:N,N'-diacetyllegionaminate synthase